MKQHDVKGIAGETISPLEHPPNTDRPSKQMSSLQETETVCTEPGLTVDPSTA